MLIVYVCVIVLYICLAEIVFTSYMLCKSEQFLQLSTGFLSIFPVYCCWVFFFKSRPVTYLSPYLSNTLSTHPLSPIFRFDSRKEESLIEKDCKREGDGDHGQRWCDRESKEMWML